ncbi:MAG: N(4)-(beta-N-acetylglucosaminyl)-L-asparaginase [Bacteroidetes bacterium]|nr:N(4)-(beta-N-acetylglucosaminyl)-L-asparaginase [Bacteroidota bacterium]
MYSRKNFIKMSMLGLGVVAAGCSPAQANEESESKESKLPVFDRDKAPIVLSTWDHGMAANAGAWPILESGGAALDAVEKGVMVTESDPTNRSVGLAGLPDRDGFTTLDACIMDHESRCGSVAFLQNIEHPIAVARMVMEETPHVMLVGEGAYEFAISKGFTHKEFLDEKSKAEVAAAYAKWLETSQYQPIINRENHDTIGLIAMDAQGNLSGACTTSGMAYKLHGRVGDSPIIGAGLFVDNEVGAATATGVGEAVIRIAGSHTVVELMRQGYTPQEACKQAVERIIKKHKDLKNLQVGFLALNKAGEFGGYSVYEGFNFALRTKSRNEMVKTAFDRKW